MKKTIFNILRFSFFLGIGIFFIWLFMRNLTSDQKQEIFDSLRIANYYWILAAIVLGILSHLSRTLRWKILLEPMGYKPATGNVFMAVMIGYLANLALPRLGEVSRCGILTRYEKIPFNKSFGTVITERAIDMLSFILLFFLMLVTQSGKLQIYIEQKIYEPLQRKFNLAADPDFFLIILLLAFSAAGIILFIVIRKKFRHTVIYQKFSSLFNGFLEGIRSLAKIKRPFQFIVHTVFIWFLYLLMAYIVFFSLKETSGLGLDAGLAVLIFGSIGIMIVQGGIGIYPAIVAETLFIYSIPATTGYALGWLIWSSQTIMILLAGVFSLLLLPVLNRSAYVKAGNTTEESTQPSGT
ncbi:MAG: flippase-like domain-containing protein [Bacteroidales bacterium]|nr:flippase-like domain-containing protein [Bacteroidales bacterium]MBK9356625.1 flippase-like domain-containing protein [Bacteroidales bacterium]